VRRLDWSLVASTHVDDVVGGLAFDGTRVGFATQPCQTTAIGVWDIREAKPPRQSRSACPSARAVRDSASLATAARLRLKLSCPRRPPLGCIGRVHLVVFAGGEYATLGTRVYGIPFGRSRTLSVGLDRHARRFLARHRAARLFAATIAYPRGDDSAHSTPDSVRYFELPIRRP
jgi:hypothetical protein